NMPAVSYLKAPGYQDCHGGYSNPLDEQEWLVNTINRIKLSKDWDSTVIIIIYDDSDGYYDHVYSPKSQFSDINGRQGY
ncbi:phospholipase, partial [Francisella tularensis subsp. holarctica]|uniref:alkaline phosphatase family protein n=1 Tax=Francisella tularensis TaxID=263 RepID=UPI002381B57D